MLRQVTTLSVVSFEELNHLVTYDKKGVPRSYSDLHETNHKERRTSIVLYKFYFLQILTVYKVILLLQ